MVNRRILLIFSFLTLWVVLSPPTLPAFSQITETKVAPADGEMLDAFGSSVCISGDYAIVGAARDDDKGYNSGSAYILRREGTDWIEEAKLIPGDGAPIDYFGSVVSISGEYAVIGAIGDDDNGNLAGAAYVFRFDGLGWIEEAKLTSSDGVALDQFGASVAISGQRAIIGAFWDDDNGVESGSAYVFRREGTTWVEEAKFTASDGSSLDIFGYSVGISGDHAIVGAPWDDDNGGESGSAYIFRRDSTGWVQEAKLTPADGTENDLLGMSVSISDNRAVVSSHHDDDLGDASGSAYVFVRNGTNWTEEAKLIPGDGSADDNFGYSVCISDSHVVAGAYADDDNGMSSGSAYIFSRKGTSWSELAKLVASDGEADDFFGLSVSLSGDYCVSGVLGDNVNGFSSGSAYIYSGFSGTTTEVPGSENGQIPRFILHQNYPNPFNPKTEIRFHLPARRVDLRSRRESSTGQAGIAEGGLVSLRIYDMLGQEVAVLVDERLAPGEHSREWDAKNFPGGVYLYRLRAGDLVETKKLVLLR